jgi:hypothetical protein
MRSALAAATTVALLGPVVSACDDSSSTAGTTHGAAEPAMATSTGDTMSSMPAISSTPGMEDMPLGDGLSSSVAGYTLKGSGTATAVTFTIVDKQGKPVTAYKPDQTKLMHFYLIRSDLTGFQHVHPTMAADGTWTAPIDKLHPGHWRMYASFIPSGMTAPLVLGQKLIIPGTATKSPLPTPATSTAVDGYTVTVSGTPMAGMAHPLAIQITKDGQPVTDLQPYLGTLAHLTAIHHGDLAFAHMHPHGANGSDLSVEAMLPKAGNWRLFIQFQTAGTLHTTALTLPVR